MDIVVKGRNVEVPDHYRQHVAEKLRKAERFDQKIIRVDVELCHEPNPRQSDHCQRVEITCYSRGPVIRAEAGAGDFYSALDVALAKLDNRLRRGAGRRRIHRGRRAPVSVAAATAGLDQLDRPLTTEQPATPSASVTPSTGAEADRFEDMIDEEEAGLPGRIVRVKRHQAEPMTVDDALFQMELVGHDFYLFLDKETAQPSVVYRRHAYDYGVISLTD